MLCQGTGILAIWHDIAPGRYDDFIEWHSRQHMPERVGLDGFLRGCRYAGPEASPRCFNFYQTESPHVLTAPHYLERLNNPTPWTQQILPLFRNVIRSAGQVLHTAGAGEGGVIATLRAVSRDLGQPSESERTLWHEVIDELLNQTGVVAAHLWAADRDASLVRTTESQTRGRETGVADLTCAIEGNSERHVTPAARRLLDHPKLNVLLDPSAASLGIYHLQHRM